MDYYEIRNVSQLKVFSQLGLQICDDRFDELLNLRLSDDENMVKTMRSDAVNSLITLHEQFYSIDVVIVEESKDILLTTVDLESYAELLNLPKKMPQSSEVYRLNNGAYIHWQYFPFWKWHIIALMTREEALLPVFYMRSTLIFIVSILLFLFTASLYIVFNLRVTKPLRTLKTAAEQIRAGNMKETGIHRSDEIGIVSEAFDEMVKSLDESIRKLQNTVDQKGELLMEVHHRVRNNLNVIISLLNLRMETLKDSDDYMKAFEDSKNRIMTIALVHGHLYDSGDFGFLHLDSFLPDLIDHLKDSYPENGSIEFTYRLEPLKVKLDSGVTLGLILYEVLSNIFNHAYEKGQSGRVDINCGRRGGECFLKISNDGRGAEPADLERSDSRTMGISLIKELCLQLGAEVLFENKNGLEVTILVGDPSFCIKDSE